jgi:hypothetical protein
MNTHSKDSTNIRPKTMFIDIDGCILKHRGNLEVQITNPPELLPGVKEKFDQWDRKGYNIILISGRRESSRKITEEQLAQMGIFYDQLILGLGGGDRVIINDKKPNSDSATAFAINLCRNEGFGSIDL